MVPRVDGDHIEGRRPVVEALRAGRKISKILLARGTRGVDDILRLARDAGVPVQQVPAEAITRRTEGRHAQGVIAIAEEFEYAGIGDVLDRAAASSRPPLVVAADGITDPRNLGALARSAEAAGAHGLLLRPRRSVLVTPVVEKAAAGALEHLPVVVASNLASALEDLKSKGLWVVVLDERGTQTIYDFPVADQPLCVVTGDEGEGVSRLVRDRADLVVRIPMSGAVASLNTSVAAAVALFEVGRRRNLHGSDIPPVVPGSPGLSPKD